MMNGITNKNKKGIKLSKIEQHQNLYDTTKGVLREQEAKGLILEPQP